MFTFDHYRIVMLDKTKFMQVCEVRLGAKSLRFHFDKKKRPQPAPPGCGLSTSATAETAAVLSFGEVLQNCNV
jgi:hypothetical protein